MSRFKFGYILFYSIINLVCSIVFELGFMSIHLTTSVAMMFGMTYREDNA